MSNKISVAIKEFISKIDKAAGIQLTMILLTIVVYGFFLSVQSFLLNFDELLTKIVIVNVLLGVGLLIEVVYFIWHTNKQGKEKPSVKEVKEEEKTEIIKEQEEEQSE